jgi:UDP-N-acetylmuramoyl-tripeptide--D-alanyl-D-alanine ligase
MADLGVHSEVEHRRIAEVAAALGVRLVAVAEPAYAAAENAADPDEAIEVIGPLGPGDAVLVKASRSAGLERLAAALVAD